MDEKQLTNNAPNFIFIDGSYFIFYRFYALCVWWRNAYPLELDVLNSPATNDKFVEKFKKTFVAKVAEIAKKLKVSNPIIIVGKDCKRDQIWRNELFPQYKIQRATGAEDGFMGGPFFQLAYEDKLFIQGGAKSILEHCRLEADDCIAITTKLLLQKYPNCTISIIASDKDYLQLIEPRVNIYNLTFKNLAHQKAYSGNPACELFCKIVSGDVSDNIPPIMPRCGHKTALKHFNNMGAFEAFIDSNPVYRDNYKLNQTIIDFKNIPQQYVDELLNKQTIYYKS